MTTVFLIIIGLIAFAMLCGWLHDVYCTIRNGIPSDTYYFLHHQEHGEETEWHEDFERLVLSSQVQLESGDLDQEIVNAYKALSKQERAKLNRLARKWLGERFEEAYAIHDEAKKQAKLNAAKKADKFRRLIK